MSEATIKDDGPQKSPDGLGFKTKPKGVVRVSKKAAAIGGFILVLALMAIVLGIATRKPKTAGAASAETSNTKLAPALQAGENISRDIPDGNLPVLQSKESKDVALSPASPAAVPGQAGQASAQSAVPSLNDGRLPPRPGNTANPTMPAQGGIDPEEERVRRLREERENNLKKAMEAGTPAQAGGSGTGLGGFNPAAATGIQPGTALQTLQAMAGQGGAAAGRAPMPAGAPSFGGQREEDQNMQAQKQQFVRDMEAVPDRNHVNSTRKGQISPYEVKAGWIIPATMEHGINSDLPGKITARVTQNVYDTATGNFLLIPQGAQLMGAYDSQVAYGQNGLLVSWRRIIFPDGSSVDLEGMGGSDASGYAGFRDKINNHYGRIIGFGLMTSLFSAAFQISQNERNNGTNGYQQPTASQTAGAAVAQQMSQLGIEIARKNLRVQPTIEIRPGYQFNVRVDKDLLFSRPYAFGNAR
ncbi:TrbI/VirB10 family protein [Comamonas sp. A7-5]|jgi:type IV secretion system protein VirB10